MKNQSNARNLLHFLPAAIISFCTKHGLTILRLSLSLVFTWFGGIKFMPFINEAERIGADTIQWMVGDGITLTQCMWLLGALECIIGLGLLVNRALPFILLLLFAHMIGTLLPLVIFPDKTWTAHFPIPTLLGQYIIKNIVFIAVGIVLIALINDAAKTKKAKDIPERLTNTP